MSVVNPPGGGSVGYLYWAAWKVYDVASQFRHIGQSIRSVFIIGKWLSYPFILISSFLFGLVDKLIRADRELQTTYAWIKYIADGWGFLQLLRWASYQFEMIRQNPKGWLLVTLAQISWFAVLALTNPVGYIRNFIRQVHFMIGLLFDNPAALLRFLIARLNPLLLYLFTSPRNFIMSQLSQLMPDLYAFLVNPVNYLHSILRRYIWSYDLLLNNPFQWIMQLIARYNYQAYLLLTNPELLIKQKVAAFFGFGLSFWQNPFYFLLQAIINEFKKRRLFFIPTLKELFVDIILYFI